MPRVKGATGERGATDTRRKLVEATTALLVEQGFARTTTRAIGAAAGCNSALVSYHFGSLNALLLTALDESSSARMARYQAALGNLRGRREVLAVLRRLYREDQAAGHVALLCELVAGGLMDAGLGREVASRVEPWVAFTEETVRTSLPAALRRRVPARELAYAIVAGFLGLELLDRLLGERAQGAAVLDRLTVGAPWWRALGESPTETGGAP